MKKILIATKNKGKVDDFRAIFDQDRVEIISLLDLDSSIEDIEETGETFSENAILKAEGIAEQMNLPVLADDSGLSIDYLDGRPGVYSARYAGSDKDDQRNIEKVLSELEGVPLEKRGASFICALAFAVPGKETIVKYGKCSGVIVEEPIGENGFGYDPIFMPDGYNLTMAQLSPEEKGRISHRGKALKEMAAWLELEGKEGFD
ncbi:XTP/dITP diphosphatase [Amphibacillus xylanus]|uniref:dITP/XTP pyrophosphatase n=1 Tax=Amphibacillus xylanus (strain ATCC 51415 / DSM 6626 / JCM 7361 / LMG 17667 / NBRC 15112 / Ep01) TaxID=698758 RepID=K0J3I9_AMPXN|nr:XTP/dITP diphosphatase [Amphibacillus xylanus]BAM47116.1 nucleoside-triphosphatase [Amphibacillus xylanus NBRC 15112]